MPKGQAGTRSEESMHFARNAEFARRNKRIKEDYFGTGRRKPMHVADIAKKYNISVANVYRIAGDPYNDITAAQYAQLTK